MTASATDQLTAAQSMAAAATAGIALDSPTPAAFPSVALFSAPPADYAGALRHAAYWTGVAARGLRSRTLGLQAGAYAAKATVGVLSFSTVGTAEAMTDAANEIGAAMKGSTDGPGLAVAGYARGKLAEFSTPGALQLAQDDDDSTMAQLRRTLAMFQDAAKKIAKVAAVGTGIVVAAVLGGALWWFVSKRRKR